MKKHLKLININRISLVICFTLALFIVISYEDNQSFYKAVESKILDVTEPVLSSTTSSIRATSNFFENIDNIFSTLEDNKKLKERNEFLEYYFYLYKQNDGENKALKEQLKFAQNLNNQYITGQIISQTNNHLNQQITINAGSNNGIKKWQMVLANNNLIGRVVEVSKHTASILLITDYNSRIPVIGSSSRVKFIASGQATEELDCNYLGDKLLEEHELVITSGDNELIIPNIIVGIAIKKGNIFYIKPNIDVNQIEFVQVLKQSDE